MLACPQGQALVRGRRTGSGSHERSATPRVLTRSTGVLKTGLVSSPVLSGLPAHFLLCEVVLQPLQALGGRQVDKAAQKVPVLDPGVPQLVSQLPVRTKHMRSAVKREQKTQTCCHRKWQFNAGVLVTILFYPELGT